MTSELSNETIEKIARETADIVCERIGNALMTVSIGSMIVGLGFIAFGSYMKGGGCPFNTKGSPMVVRVTDPSTGEVTRYCAAGKLAD